MLDGGFCKSPAEIVLEIYGSLKLKFVTDLQLTKAVTSLSWFMLSAASSLQISLASPLTSSPFFFGKYAHLQSHFLMFQLCWRWIENQVAFSYLKSFAKCLVTKVWLSQSPTYLWL